MEEMIDFRTPEEPGNGRAVLVKWLKLLLTVQTVALVLSAVSMVFTLLPVDILVSLVGLADQVLNLCVIVALFYLSAVNERYRKAFIASVIAAIGTMAERLQVGPGLAIVTSLLSLAGSIAGLVAVYQEYHGHGEIAENARDSELAGKWGNLFVWQFVVGILIGAVSVGLATIGTATDMDANTIVAIVLPIAMIPGLGLQVIYLRYLKKTLVLVE